MRKLWIALLLFCQPLLAIAQPKVVVTLKPIHSLVASIMEGVDTPSLLLPDGSSPHHFQLKPSTLKEIQTADLIIWVGPTLENFMEKPLTQVKPKLGILSVLDTPNLKKWPLREDRDWAHSEHQHDHDHSDNTDPHIWLSLSNAKLIAQAIADYLSKADVKHAKIYQGNAKKLHNKLDDTQQQMHTLLDPIKNKPYLVYHDGYQYLEKEFNLNGAGTIVINPSVPLSGKGLYTIRELIKQKQIVCVFRETEFSDNFVKKTLGELNVKIDELDPLGTRFAPGVGNYEKTMLQIGKTMRDCLG